MTGKPSRRKNVQEQAEEKLVEEIVQVVVEVVAEAKPVEATPEPQVAEAQPEPQVAEATAETAALPHHAKLYITPAEWGRIYAKAWQSKKFKRAFEENPIAAIRAKFPEIEFELVYKVPVRPRSITDDQIKRLANGEEIVFPNVPIGPLVYYQDRKSVV